MGKHIKISAGDKFTVKPNIVVTVVEYHTSQSILVKDEEGNQRAVDASNLRSGNVLWRHKDGRLRQLRNGDRFKKNAPPKVGERYESTNYGWFRVICLEGRGLMTIEFEDTGSVRRGVNTYVASTGGVRDLAKHRNIGMFEKYEIGSKWESNNWGSFTVIGITDSQNVSILWTDTGHVQHGVSTASISSGMLKDQSICEDSWDYLKPAKGMHYIYFAVLNGEVIYVGQGYHRRYLHANSGMSHNLELNRLYFSGEKVTVEIHKDSLTKEEAAVLEKTLIKEMNPRCNVRVYVVQPVQETLPLFD